MSLSMPLREMIARYDTFFIDQFGTLRDAASPYPGAVEALLALRAAGKTVVILSNSGKSGADNALRLQRIGFPPESFSHFVTSGDVAVDLLERGELDLSLSSRTRCFTISNGGDSNLADRLGLSIAAHPQEADLLVISGSQADEVGMEAYGEMLRPAAERGLPAICTNPDIQMITPGGLAPAAGSIARLYEKMGGRVSWIGKPHRDIYEFAYRLSGFPNKARTVGIGDSLDHDIAGANAFGIAAILLRKGVSARADEKDLRAEAMRAGLRLQAIIDDLA